MGCSNCEIRSVVDGRSAHILLLTDNLEKIYFDNSKIITLYKCPKCLTYWELGGYDKSATEVDPLHIKKNFPSLVLK